MGHLSKLQISRRNASQKGGRGKKKHRIPESPVKTPLKPKTTAWRHRKKAAAAEKVLHAAALANIKPTGSSRQSTGYMSINIMNSRPSTAENMSFTMATSQATIGRPSTGYKSIEEIMGSVSTTGRTEAGSFQVSDTGGGFDELGFLEEENQGSETEEGLGFEDIEKPDLMAVGDNKEVDKEYAIAVKRWPYVGTLEVKQRVLEKGILDIEKLLSSKHSPAGQDLTRHLQVLYFMNWQVMGIKQRLGIKPQFRKCSSKLLSRKQCAMNVAIGFRKGQWVQERIMKHEKIWIQKRRIPPGLQGINAKVMCMLEDEETMMVVQECIAGAGANFRAQMLATAVTNYWKISQPNLYRHQQLQQFSMSLHSIEQHCNEQHTTRTVASHGRLSLSVRTAVAWLHRLGYTWQEVRKGIYKDGHERQDVVHYRQEVFLKKMEALQPRMPYPIKNVNDEVIDIGIPILQPNQRLCIPVAHDECTCNANDGPHHHWIKGDENPIRKKSRGQGLHISEFITPLGRLKISPNQVSDKNLLQLGLDSREATEIIECGGDIWWNQEHIVQQTLTAITIFEVAYPDAQGLFLFDNATSHSAFAEDALRANKMNKGWGGKQPCMRDGYFINRRGDTIVQKMSFEHDEDLPKHFWDEPKGLQVVLEERGLWPKGGLYLDCITRKTTAKTQRKHTGDRCWARHLLSQQPDFKAQKGQVQEVVEARGHLVLFYPRFYCELNWIEYFWARVKVYTRTHCGYDIKSLRENVPKALEWAAPLIPKWWGKALRIMQTYSE